MTPLTFTVLGTPAPQGSFRAAYSEKSKRAFVIQSCKRTMPWRQEVAAAAERAMRSSDIGLFLGPLKLTACFFMPRPKGHYGKRGLRPSSPPFPDKKPDLSKLVRALEDAMTGIVYGDDAQIVLYDVSKLYAGNRVPPPGVSVTIEVVDGVESFAC